MESGYKRLVAKPVLRRLKRYRKETGTPPPFTEGEVFGILLDRALMPWLFEEKGKKILGRVRPEPESNLGRGPSPSAIDPEAGGAKQKAMVQELGRVCSRDPELAGELIRIMREEMEKPLDLAKRTRYFLSMPGSQLFLVNDMKLHEFVQAVEPVQEKIPGGEILFQLPDGLQPDGDEKRDLKEAESIRDAWKRFRRYQESGYPEDIASVWDK